MQAKILGHRRQAHESKSHCDFERKTDSLKMDPLPTSLDTVAQRVNSLAAIHRLDGYQDAHLWRDLQHSLVANKSSDEVD